MEYGIWDVRGIAWRGEMGVEDNFPPTKLTTEWIKLISAQSNTVCEESSKKTISPEHVLEALKVRMWSLCRSMGILGGWFYLAVEVCALVMPSQPLTPATRIRGVHS